MRELDTRDSHTISDPAHPYSGCHYAENLSAGLIARMYEEAGQLTGEDYSPAQPLLPNQYLVLRNGKKSVLATYGPSGDGDKGYAIRRVNKESVYGITPRNVEQTFAVHALLNREVKTGDDFRQDRHRQDGSWRWPPLSKADPSTGSSSREKTRCFGVSRRCSRRISWHRTARLYPRAQPGEDVHDRRPSHRMKSKPSSHGQVAP